MATSTRRSSPGRATAFATPTVLRRAAWGRGLATEGARALVAHAFEVLRHPVVDACAHPDDAASIAVMKKCGMRFAGTFMHPRVPIEVVRYLVLRPLTP